MRFLPAAVFIICAAFCISLEAGLLPAFPLEAGPLKYFENYVAQYEKDVYAAYAESGKLWIDTVPQNGAYTAGKPVLQARENKEIGNSGSLHHFTGAMRIPGATIADIRHIMEDYPNYPKYFKPDVGKGSGEVHPDSKPEDEHYTAHLSLIQQTLWIAVSFDCVYDTHYRYNDPHHWSSSSSTVSIKEWRDPKDVSRGYYPEGEDHGFLWRANTFWYARDTPGGIDVQVDSLSLSRPVPAGFAWWGTKRTKDAVDKMLKDMKAAIAELHQAQHS
jgi:hypothetical protein